jgi:hypothetical protein
MAQLIRDKMSEMRGDGHGDGEFKPDGIFAELKDELEAKFDAGDFTIGDAYAFAKQMLGGDGGLS